MKGQVGPGIMTAILIALMVPLLLIMFYIVQVTFENATEGTLTLSANNYEFGAIANNTATTLGQNYLYEDTGLTFNVSGLVEDTNYTVDWDAGTLTWVGAAGENDSTYQIDYEYFLDAQRATFTDIQGNTQDSYDMAGILPIAVIGIAVLATIIGALGGFIYLKRD